MFAHFLRYQKSIEIYEDIARQSLSNNLLKYGVKGHLLNAGICQLCKADIVAINKALERYQVRLVSVHIYSTIFWIYVINICIFSVFLGIGSYIFWNTRVQIACGMSWLPRVTYVFSFCLLFSMRASSTLGELISYIFKLVSCILIHCTVALDL